MKIKRRLFISNILMIVIPVIVALFITFCGTIFFWSVLFMGSGSDIGNEKQYYEIRSGLMEMTKELLRDSDETVQKQEIAKIKNILEKNNMSLIVFADNEKQYSFGVDEEQYNSKLLEVIWSLGGEGLVSVGNEEIKAEKVLVNGQTYTVCIFSTTVVTNYETMNVTMVSISILIFIVVLIIVFLTNRFLIQFVFKKIKQPLDILVDGVHQIRDGNLDYQIMYKEKDEFLPVCQDFNEMASRLKESVILTQKQEKNRRELLAGISHDLRSPLTSIKAYSEGLLDGVAQTKESQNRYALMIKTKAEDIDQMIAKMFLFSKMELDDYPYNPEVVNLVEEISILVDTISEEYESKGLTIHIQEIVADIDVYTDQFQLRSAFMNILDNSLKYKVREKGNINIWIEKQNQEVWIYIDDDGDGVPDEILPNIFEVFYRGDSSRRNPDQGSGLGLAIAEKAIKRMDGSIHAENRETGGLRMAICLPIHKGEEH